MKDNSSRNKKKSKWIRVLKEDFEKLLKSRSYEVKEDGTFKIESWHINLGTVVEISENYFAIHLPPDEIHCFRKDPKTTLEGISSELIMVLSEYIKLKGEGAKECIKVKAHNKLKHVAA
ncbi:unnamed protein product [marine sediment metagenome]|uniref:Uncharacterized protein n=1 Tax=marine sediment metagenome TaxID=412755 RepID=X0YJI5_9ZZZZ